MRIILSKSIIIMFIFDFFVFMLFSYLTAKETLPDKTVFSCVFLTTFFGLFVLFLKDDYKIREFNISIKNMYRLFEGIIIAHIPATVWLYFTEQSDGAVKFLGLNILIVFLALQLYRIIFHIYLFNVKKIKNVLIIGANKNARLIADEIINKKALRMNIIGFINGAAQEEEQINDDKIKILGNIQDLKEIIDENNIDIVIISFQSGMEESFLTEMVLSIPHYAAVYTMHEFYELVTGKYYIENASINSLFYDYMKKRSLAYGICKRAFDIITALIILVPTSPVLAYIMLRVKLTDGGSPVYTQTRIGRGGKPFKMYKLRTMYINDYIPKAGSIADTGNQDKDERVIPFCKFVRKARFDEIPQMINILRGDMSIVGPRTEWEDLVNIYSAEIPYYKCRQWIRTGWTGWAQINQGHCVLNDDIREKLQYDLYYLKHKNIVWDVCILIKAVFMALSGRHG